MRRKNAIIFSLIVILVSAGFSFLGINAALYGFEKLPVAGKVYSWVIHVKNSQAFKFTTISPSEKNTGTSKSDAAAKAGTSKTAKNKKPEAQNSKTQNSNTKKGITQKQNEAHKPDFILEATAYVDTGQTKSQIYAGVGSVAVDPKVVPHGTLLYIEGYGLALATDTGRLIKGYSVDVWFSEEKKAREWGRKKVKVWKVGQADIKKILATGGKYVKY